ncbi:YggS family pyridoxal phosphate-dependent enzyme [Roseobacter sp. HKCCA0434]|uniref:YggS family pyridoxal phosphate-dependent enzyme n=1 Tax=Roseobacter sp. HKCCA0434 TaxID=3079297 RepID=UPI002905CA26|nr:YggS family pyridoxal phosphate-dependent enzyme [Roseobacter sp. HKCCA0434]
MPLDDVKQRIEAARTAAGRTDPVHLIAVSKVQPDARVTAVLDQGHRLYGENKVQEAQGKWPAFRETYPDTQVHLIGPLQSNKARPAMQLFDAIHTLDRPKLAQRIADLAQELGHCPELFIQVNTGEEPQKSGLAPADLDAFVAEVRSLDLPLTGLMCIPPAEEAPSLHFALLAKLAKRNGLTGLSMGMSGDFEEAVRFGATHVRVGSAIFGERDYG